MRVASAVPALTETLYALGVQPVAVSAACDYPPPVASTPTFVEPRIDETADSATIDERVSEHMQDAGGLYRIQASVLNRTNPDLILTEGTCDVCAVTDEQIRDTTTRLDVDAAIHSFHPHTLADTLEIIERLGTLLARPAEADRLLTNLRTRLAAVEARTSDRSLRPDTLVLDWTDPPMVAGHWTPELVDLAGGRALHAKPGRPAGSIDWERIRTADPEVLLVAPCGFDCTRGVEALHGLTERAGWAELSAVQNDQVYVLDGTQLINRPGPRLIESLELIESLLHEPPARLDGEGLVATASSG